MVMLRAGDSSTGISSLIIRPNGLVSLDIHTSG